MRCSQSRVQALPISQQGGSRVVAFCRKGCGLLRSSVRVMSIEIVYVYVYRLHYLYRGGDFSPEEQIQDLGSGVGVQVL